MLMRIQSLMAMATANTADTNMLVWELEISHTAKQALMNGNDEIATSE
jgi:hypothetical protein